MDATELPQTVDALRRELAKAIDSAAQREHEQQKSVDRAREIFDLNLSRKEKEIDNRYRDELSKNNAEIRRLEAVIKMREVTIGELGERLRTHNEDKIAAVRQEKANQMASVEDSNSEVKRLRGEVERRRFLAEEAANAAKQANDEVRALHRWIRDWVHYVNNHQLQHEAVIMEEANRRTILAEERLGWDLLIARHFSPFILRSQEARIQNHATVREILTTVRSEVLLDGLPKKVLDMIVAASSAGIEGMSTLDRQEVGPTGSALNSSLLSSNKMRSGGGSGWSPRRVASSTSSPRPPITEADLYRECLDLIVPITTAPPIRTIWGAPGESCSQLSSPHGGSISVLGGGVPTRVESLSRTPTAEELLAWATRNKAELKKCVEAATQDPASPELSPVIPPKATLTLTSANLQSGAMATQPAAPQEEDEDELITSFTFGNAGGTAITISSPQQRPSIAEQSAFDASDTTHEGGASSSSRNPSHTKQASEGNDGRPASLFALHPTLEIGMSTMAPRNLDGSVSRIASSISTIVSHPARRIPGASMSVASHGSLVRPLRPIEGGPAHPYQHRGSILSSNLTIVDPAVNNALHVSAVDVQSHIKEFAETTVLLLQYIITHHIRPQGLHVEALKIKTLQLAEKLACLEGEVVDRLNSIASRVSRSEGQCQRVAARVDTRQHDPARHFSYRRTPSSPTVYSVPKILLEEGSPGRRSHSKRSVQFAHPSLNEEIAAPAECGGGDTDNAPSSSSVAVQEAVNQANMEISFGEGSVSNRDASPSTKPPSGTSAETLEDILATYEEELKHANTRLEEVSTKYAGGCTKGQMDALIARLHHGERDREQLQLQVRATLAKVSGLEAEIQSYKKQQEGWARATAAAPGRLVVDVEGLENADFATSSSRPVSNHSATSQSPLRPSSGGVSVGFHDMGRIGGWGGRKTANTPVRQLNTSWKHENNNGVVPNITGGAGRGNPLVDGALHSPPLQSALARRTSSTASPMGNGGLNLSTSSAPQLTQQLNIANKEISRLQRDNKDLRKIVKKLRREPTLIRGGLDTDATSAATGTTTLNNSTTSASLASTQHPLIAVETVVPRHTLLDASDSEHFHQANIFRTPSSLVAENRQRPSSRQMGVELESLKSELSELQMQLLAARRDRDTWRQRTDTALAQAAHSEEQRLKSVHRYLGLMGRREEETSQWIIKTASKIRPPSSSQQLLTSLNGSTTSVPEALPAVLPPATLPPRDLRLASVSPTGASLLAIERTNASNPNPSYGGGNIDAVLSVAEQIKPGGASIVEDLLARREEQLRLIQVERQLVREGAKKAVQGLATQAAELSYREEQLATKAKTLRDRELVIGQAEDKVAHALRSAKLKNGGRPLLLPRKGEQIAEDNWGDDNNNDRSDGGDVPLRHDPSASKTPTSLPPLLVGGGGSNGEGRRQSGASQMSLNSEPQPTYSHPQRYSPLDKLHKKK